MHDYEFDLLEAEREGGVPDTFLAKVGTPSANALHATIQPLFHQPLHLEPKQGQRELRNGQAGLIY